jgi:hypothetical protein
MDRLLFIENKSYFLKKLDLVLREIRPFLHISIRQKHWFVNCMLTLCTPHAIINVFCIKPKPVKLERCTFELKQQTLVSKGKNISGDRYGNYPFGQ